MRAQDATPMKELLRTNDPVRLSWLQALLSDSRDREPGARPSHQPRRRQHRRDPAPPDGGRARSRPRPRAARGRPARTPGERIAGRGTAGLHRGPRCSAAGSGCASRPTAIASRSTRCFSPPRCRPSRISWCSMSAAAPARRCCAWRRGCRICRVVGLEMQRELVRLAGDNAILNGMEARVSVMIGDLLHPPPRLSPGAFDHVMANPPYHRARPRHAAGEAAASAAPRSRATPISPPGCASRWRWCGRKARSPSSIAPTASTRCSAQIAGRAGEVVVFPLWPGEDRPASRILVRARKQVAAPARLAAGLVLHGPDGRPTDAPRPCCARAGLEL